MAMDAGPMKCYACGSSGRHFGSRAPWGAAVLAAALTAALALALPATGAAANRGLRVRGNKLVFGRGHGRVVQLRGVSRSGTEYACIGGWGFFDSPHPDRID